MSVQVYMNPNFTCSIGIQFNFIFLSICFNLKDLFFLYWRHPVIMFSCRHIQRIANCYHGSKKNERVRNPKQQIRIRSFYFPMPIIKKYIISSIRNMVNFERCENFSQNFRSGHMNTSHKWNISVDEKTLKCACFMFFFIYTVFNLVIFQFSFEQRTK